MFKIKIFENVFIFLTNVCYNVIDLRNSFLIITWNNKKIKINRTVSDNNSFSVSVL